MRRLTVKRYQRLSTSPQNSTSNFVRHIEIFKVWKDVSAILVAFTACYHSPPATKTPLIRSVVVVGEAGDRRTEILLQVPEMMVVGDTALGWLRMRECRSDLCSPRVPHWGEWSWSTDRSDRLIVYHDPEILARHPNLVRRSMVDGKTQETSYQNLEEERPLIARRAGRVTLTVSGAEGTMQKTIAVIPPIASFAWEPNITSARVGDTLRLHAVARSANGKILAKATELATFGNERTARTESVGSWKPDQLNFVFRSAGIFEARAKLNKREAVLRINVSAAPPNH